MMEEEVALLTSRTEVLTPDYWDNNNKGGTRCTLPPQHQGYEEVAQRAEGWRCRLLAQPDPDPDLVNDDDPQHGLLLSAMGHLSLQHQRILRSGLSPSTPKKAPPSTPKKAPKPRKAYRSSSAHKPSTPHKVPENACVVCAKRENYTNLDSVVAGRDELRARLYQYGGFTVDEGGICRKCKDRLLRLNRDANEFRKDCAVAMRRLNAKRMSRRTPEEDSNKKAQVEVFATPLMQNTPQNLSRPVDMQRTQQTPMARQLFSMDATMMTSNAVQLHSTPSTPQNLSRPVDMQRTQQTPMARQLFSMDATMMTSNAVQLHSTPSTPQNLSRSVDMQRTQPTPMARQLFSMDATMMTSNAVRLHSTPSTPQNLSRPVDMQRTQQTPMARQLFSMDATMMTPNAAQFHSTPIPFETTPLTSLAPHPAQMNWGTALPNEEVTPQRRPVALHNSPVEVFAPRILHWNFSTPTSHGMAAVTQTPSIRHTATYPTPQKHGKPASFATLPTLNPYASTFGTLASTLTLDSCTTPYASSPLGPYVTPAVSLAPYPTMAVTTAPKASYTTHSAMAPHCSSIAIVNGEGTPVYQKSMGRKAAIVTSQVKKKKGAEQNAHPVPIDNNMANHDIRVDQSKQPTKPLKQRKEPHIRCQKLPTALVRLLTPVKDSYIPEDQLELIWSAVQTQRVKTIASAIVQNEELVNTILELLGRAITMSSAEMGKRLLGEVGYLMKKEFTDMEHFDWGKVVEDGCKWQPVLMALMASTLIHNYNSIDELQEHLPRLGMAYSILVQGRNQELSLVQRVNSMVLYNNLCDQKVYDRLQPMGLTLGYGRTNDVLKQLAEHYDDKLTAAILQKKRFRIVGDNINWRTTVADEREDRHGKMHNAFGSIVIVQNLDFEELSPTAPQVPHYLLPGEVFLPNEDDWSNLRYEYIVLIAHILIRHVPFFSFLKQHLPEKILGAESERLSQKNTVIPLPVLFKNEQKYDDVTDILDFYMTTIKKAYDKAKIPLAEDLKIHIGGDQLTRERFVGAMLLAIGRYNDPERFKHLGPVTFELFHMNMNFLMLIFKHLYKDGSVEEPGTMRYEKSHIFRNSVDKDVRKAYDHDRDFVISFVDAYIVEAVLQHFNMTDASGQPKEITPPAEGAERDWIMKHLGDVVDQFVAPGMTSLLQEFQRDDVIVDGRCLNLPLRGGARLPLLILLRAQRLRADPKMDHVKNYGHRVLELGLLFKSLLDLVHLPDRTRGIRLLKYAMLYFRENSRLSKYAYEIMRILVHQKCALSERGAHEQFYGLFCNTKGTVDGNVACDDRMEWAVHDVKHQLKHMASNKTEANIITRTKAVVGVNDITVNFDSTSDTIVRSKKHSIASANADEVKMFEGLRELQPFVHQDGRSHTSFQKQTQSLLTDMDVADMKKWISKKKYKYATELAK